MMAYGGGGDDCGGILVIAARRGGDGGRHVGGSDDSWSLSSIFRERSLKREISPFLSQMTARDCGGGPFPSYRAQDEPREWAHLRPTT